MIKNTICDILRNSIKNNFIEPTNYIPHTIIDLNKYIDKVIKLDKRILNFEDLDNFPNIKNIPLLDKIFDNEYINFKIILGAGDGWYGDDKLRITDIQGFYDKSFPSHKEKEVIYICKPSFWIDHYKEEHILFGDALIPNLNFLIKNPDKKILLCFIDTRNNKQCKKFTELFIDKIDEIDSDEQYLMNYLRPSLCHQLLTCGGICRNIPKKQIYKFENYNEILGNIKNYNTEIFTINKPIETWDWRCSVRLNINFQYLLPNQQKRLKQRCR